MGVFLVKGQGPFPVGEGWQSHTTIRMDMWKSSWCQTWFCCLLVFGKIFLWASQERKYAKQEGSEVRSPLRNPLVAVTSLEEVPGQPRMLQDLTGSCQHYHVLLQCVPLLFLSELDDAGGIALALPESPGQSVLHIFLSGENLQCYLETQPAEPLGSSF